MTLVALLLLLVLEWKLSLLRWAWRRFVLYPFERYTAPYITVAEPQTRFAAAPSPTPLHPRAAPQPEAFIQCYDKGTNTPIGLAPVHTAEQVRAAVARARVAQRTWALTPFSTRRRLLFALMDYILEHQRVICATACVECGKTAMDGALGEMLTTFEKLRWTAAHGEEVLREEVRDVGLLTLHKRACVRYVPFGVVGAIVSWNYPFHNIYGPMISALFAGNGFVGKVSEYSSFYASYYEAIVRDGLRQLGYSPDLVSFVTGYAETGAALVSCVDKLTFIGSPGVGKAIMRNAADTLTPIVLELGGKDPAVVCEDADMEQLLPIVMRGNFQNCGQNCVGLERILVHEAVHDVFVDEVVRRVRALTQGPSSTRAPVATNDATDDNGNNNVAAGSADDDDVGKGSADKSAARGPMASSLAECFDLGAMTMGKPAIDKIQQLVDASVAAGATLRCGGVATSDRFYPPTVLTNVTPSMPIAREEVFGPVLVVMKFATDAQAVAMVNDCPYGLGASVFSRNTERARALAARLQTGMVNINDFGINYLCQSLPFGGVKISGFDRFAGREGLRGNCVVRASTEDRLPGLQTTIPPILQYPICGAAFDFMENLAYVLYGRLPDRVAGAIRLAFTRQPASAHVPTSTTAKDVKATKVA